MKEIEGEVETEMNGTSNFDAFSDAKLTVAFVLRCSPRELQILKNFLEEHRYYIIRSEISGGKIYLKKEEEK